MAVVVEEDVVSERFEAAPRTSAVTTGLLVTNVASPEKRHSSFAATTLGPTVITVGRSRVRANVEPGNGSRYGGGLLDFIVTCVGISAEKGKSMKSPGFE